MAAPTFQISETNTASVTVTDNTTSVAYASVDNNSNVSNLSINNPVTAGNSSYEKFIRMKCTGVASNSLSAFGVWFPGGDPTDQASVTTYLKWYFATNASFTTPVATVSSVSTTRTNTVASSPGTAFTSCANSSGAYSGYIISQLQSLSSATGGSVNWPGTAISLGYTYS
jgi:hypothetical protein